METPLHYPCTWSLDTQIEECTDASAFAVYDPQLNQKWLMLPEDVVDSVEDAVSAVEAVVDPAAAVAKKRTRSGMSLSIRQARQLTSA